MLVLNVHHLSVNGILNNKICSSKVGSPCALHKSSNDCLGLDDDGNYDYSNYDPVSQKNFCRWSENSSTEYCNKLHQTESACNSYELCNFNVNNNKCEPKLDINGFCTDTRMLQPCQLFDTDTCPTEVKVDNMGNKIHGSNHCKLAE